MALPVRESKLLSSSRVSRTGRSSRLAVVLAIACTVVAGFPATAPAETSATAAESEKKGPKIGKTPIKVDPKLAITPMSWTAEGRKAAEELAAKLRGKGLACDQCEDGAYGIYDPKIMGTMPTPQAVISCTGNDEEDITFNIFSSGEDARKFIDIKQRYLCRQTYNNQMWFYPGFAYVANGNWVIEPDEIATAQEIASILGGEAALASCKGIWSTPTPRPNAPQQKK